MIINADSAQVYRDLPILSAAPKASERARAEHRLYGVLDGACPGSAADWAELAKAEIAQLHAQRRLPILAGGTGLYLRTLLDGIAPVPPIDPAVRSEVRAGRLEENRARLEALDPAAAERLRPSDSARTARALEVILSSGRPLHEWQSNREGGIANQVALKPLILLPQRDWLNRRCDARFAGMMDEGAVDEVQALLARNLDPELPVMRAIGVREIAAYVRGEISRDDAVTAGQHATRRYAKRQYTWFAHQPPAQWPRFEEPLEGAALDAALELVAPSA